MRIMNRRLGLSNVLPINRQDIQYASLEHFFFASNCAFHEPVFVMKPESERFTNAKRSLTLSVLSVNSYGKRVVKPEGYRGGEALYDNFMSTPFVNIWFVDRMSLCRCFRRAK